MSIIGISGKIGSGKDTVGKIIQAFSNYNYAKESNLLEENETIEEFVLRSYDKKNYLISNFQIKKFADKLKEIVCLLIGCTKEQLEDRDFKEKELGEEWNKLEVTYSDGYDEIVEIFDYNFNFETLLDAKDRVAHIHNKKVLKMTPRLLLQLLGTNCGRDIIHPDIWVNSLFNEYKERKPGKGVSFDYRNSECIDCKKPFNGDKRQFICNDCHDTHNWYPDWIITDMRFPNELKGVKDKEGITIRINGRLLCRDISGKKHSLTQEEWNIIKKSEESKGWNFTEEHESETALDNYKFDYTIDNYGTIEDLIEEVKKILINEKII